MRRKWTWRFAAALISFVFLFCPLQYAKADVGNFNNYGGDSNWSGSGNSGGSNWGGSGWHVTGSGSYSDGEVNWVIISGIVIAVFILSGFVKVKHKAQRGSSSVFTPTVVADHTGVIVPEIQKNDPNFSAEGFIGYSKEVFVTLQEAWMERDWKKIRPFEKEELYKVHEKQLDEYIRLGRINVLERINVNTAYLHQYIRDDEYEHLRVYLQVRMIDYIKDEKTGQVLKGDPNRDCHMRYLLTFTRKTGVLTQSASSQSNVVACPHCGAPTSITSAGQCEYCGFIVTTGAYSWVLSDMEAVRDGSPVDNTPLVIRTGHNKADSGQS